ncbi:MAG: hypothetical protein JWQ35_1994 [Bacteriovoracaceae bacterium]|nr:hypothetical protein [Bacteriovoracaceae bacterium]
MEEEVKSGIERFKAECEKRLPTIKLVIPIRPTGGAFLVSFTHNGVRTSGTIHEDDFADWGEGTNIDAMVSVVKDSVNKLMNSES